MVNIESNLAVAYRKNITLAASNPSEAIIFGTLTKYEPYILLPLNVEQRFAIDRAKNYALEQSIQNALNKQAATLQQQDVKAIKRAQSLVLLSRIYVGSISFEIGDDDLRRIFSPFGPIKSIALSWDPAIQKHKGFAFIEFDLPEAAGLALEQMNGHLIGGRNLRVGRPSNVPQSGTLEAEIRLEDSVKNRIYVASVHSELTDSDIQTVFEAFGKIVECTLIPDAKVPGRHRNFGYIEFEEESAAIAAVTSMNGFNLAGPQLRVCRSLTAKDSPLLVAVTSGTVATVSSVAACKLGSLASTPVTNTSATAAVGQSVLAADFGNGMGLDLPGALSSTTATQVFASPSSKTGFSQAPAPVANLPPPGIFIPTALGSGSLPVPLTQEPSEEPSNSEKDSLTTEHATAETDEIDVGDVDSNSEQPAPVAADIDPAYPSHVSSVQSPLDPPSDAVPTVAQSEELEEQELVNIESDAISEDQLQGQLIDEEGEDDTADVPLSRVLLLENMIGSQEEADDCLREEVAEECSNYGGEVIRVLIHMTTASASTEEGDSSGDGVRIFVQFDHHGAAVAARDALNGRFFAGRVVLGRLYDEERFQLRELDDPVNAD